MAYPGQFILDFVPAPDDKHLMAGYALSDDTMPTVPTPVIIGVPWHRGFWEPIEKKGPRGHKEFWLPTDDIGPIDGGHCVCLQPFEVKDSARDWTRFNQGREGSCVGWGSARGLWWMNRITIDPIDLWNEAKKIDEWSDTNPGDQNGTSVRAAMDVLRDRGPAVKRYGKSKIREDLKVEVNRWARDINDVFGCLQHDKEKARGVVRFCNSWGRHYPHFTYMEAELLERLLFWEWGEATVMVER